MPPEIVTSRRRFIQAATFGTAALAMSSVWSFGAEGMSFSDLPQGNAPAPVPFAHFPSLLHAFVWRNWELVPVERMAKTIGAKTAEILALGDSMGLPKPRAVSADQWRRSYITIIRRNWHLLSYEQLLVLLDWSAEQLVYTLREDDFLFIKLGSHKPKCKPLKFVAPDAETAAKAKSLALTLKIEFSNGLANPREPLFQFIHDLEKVPPRTSPAASRFSPKFCYSYYALYGDALLDPKIEPYSSGYLRHLATKGVDGVWLQGLLSKLAPFPWDAKLSQGHEKRLENLAALVQKARQEGIGVYLYLNEPRSMPLAFFKSHPELKGTAEGDHATLCTSVPEVQNWLRDSMKHICKTVPDLAGFFTITASENLTNCWSHSGGKGCPRCAKRQPAEVIAEFNTLLFKGIAQAASHQQLLAWDWGWADGWAPGIIERLPKGVSLMSVSEWSLPIERGGVKTAVGEYSISSIGPGPRAKRHWKLAKEHGLRVVAKIQANNTWELSAVPYIPAVANVARHAANLLKEDVDGLMLGWTLGGYPSPNLEVIAEMSRKDNKAPITPEEALLRVAENQFGAKLAPRVVEAWQDWSEAFKEFPYHIGVVYTAPLQMGPANLLWQSPTGYAATMVGIPYDDLNGWRSVYPAQIFIQQLEMVAEGFDSGVKKLKTAADTFRVSRKERSRLNAELRVAEAAALHFRSVATQARFVLARAQLGKAKSAEEAVPALRSLEQVLLSEIRDARRLYQIQCEDSRIGFEASNHYYYVPLDLVEKIINCHDLLASWVSAERKKWNV